MIRPGNYKPPTFDLAKSGPFGKAILETGKGAAARQAAVEAYVNAYLERTGERIEDLLLCLSCGVWWLERKAAEQFFEDGGGV